MVTDTEEVKYAWNVQSIVNNLMKARSLPLYYFTRNKIDNNMLKISETFWLITVLLVFTILFEIEVNMNNSYWIDLK